MSPRRTPRSACVWLYGKKIGVASSNDLSPEALKRTVDTARAIAQRQPENPEFKSMPGPQPIQNVEAFVERTAKFTPEQRAQIVNVLCKKAKEKNVVAAGAFTTMSFEIAVANSLGVFAYHPGTVAEINTVMMSDTGSGYASFAHQDASQVNAAALADEAIGKALKARAPEALEPGDYTVLLEEYAVTDLLDFLAYLSFSALAVQEERSFMKGKLGEKVMGDNVTLWDDGLASGYLRAAFRLRGCAAAKGDVRGKWNRARCGVRYADGAARQSRIHRAFAARTQLHGTVCGAHVHGAGQHAQERNA